MKKSAISLVLCLFASSSVFANDTAFGGSAANPMPIKTEGIAMVSENIVLETDAKRHAWKVTCDFVFENKTDKTITLTMGMPFSETSNEEEIWPPKGKKAPKDGRPLVWEFVSKIDGKKANTKRVKPAANPSYPNLEYMVAYTWKTTFKPKQTRKVRNTYLIGYTASSIGEMYADYILKTGAMWHGGKIGRSQLTVIMNDPDYFIPNKVPEEDYNRTTPAGYKVSKKKGVVIVEWDLKNFAPTEDVHVTFRDRDHVAHVMIDSFKLEKLTKEELRIARNTPYAIRGYRFKDPKLQKHFEKQWYYMENPNFSPKQLSSHELDFINDVKALEKAK